LFVCLSVCLFGSAAQCRLWLPRTTCFFITNNDVPRSLRLLWVSDQPVTETSTW
jgi:hypothetical protein